MNFFPEMMTIIIIVVVVITSVRSIQSIYSAEDQSIGTLEAKQKYPVK